MTTIAYKDGVLAGDSQWTEAGHVKRSGVPKIKMLANGMIIGSAGSLRDTLVAENFLSTPTWKDNVFKGPKKVKDWEAIAFWEGQVLIFSGMVIPEPLYDPFYACGSGWEFALSALALGHSSPEAVEFASKHDVYTGGQVLVAYLNNEEKTTTKPRARRSIKTPKE